MTAFFILRSTQSRRARFKMALGAWFLMLTFVGRMMLGRRGNSGMMKLAASPKLASWPLWKWILLGSVSGLPFYYMVFSLKSWFQFEWLPQEKAFSYAEHTGPHRKQPKLYPVADYEAVVAAFTVGNDLMWRWRLYLIPQSRFMAVLMLYEEICLEKIEKFPAERLMPPEFLLMKKNVAQLTGLRNGGSLGVIEAEEIAWRYRQHNQSAISDLNSR